MKRSLARQGRLQVRLFASPSRRAPMKPWTVTAPRTPAAQMARHVLPCHIEAPSAWDSTVPLLVIVETLLASVQARTWTVTEGRLKRLEELYARSRTFRRGR